MNPFFYLAFLLVLCFSCSETDFNAGLENRLIAIVDMSPEKYNEKVDFTSDDNVSGCDDHEVAYIDERVDGSDDNVYYTIRIEAKDYFKSENNCNESDWYWTEQEQVKHQLIINAYASEITENMYFESSQFVDHPLYPTSGITVYYKLEQDEDGQDNDGLGIEYFGHSAELEIKDLDLGAGVMSGTFSATLYRGTPVSDPGSFMGVDNVPDLDLYNPLINDYIADLNGDSISDYYLTDSIRIENCVFQRISIVNNMTY
tara:strand:+ start:50 stop:823 length:774 start_codon:yes stop_codon:yes gene_type:complete